MVTDNYMKGSEDAALIEVFTTNITSQNDAENIVKKLQTAFPALRINYDLGENELPYPCGHTIVRVEGATLNSNEIISTINQSGVECDILEDKICH